MKNTIFKTNILIIFAIFIGASVLFVPLISRIFLKSFALSQAKQLLNTEVTLAYAEIHPLSLSLTLHQLTLFHPQEKFREVASIGRIQLSANPLLLLFKSQVAVSLELDKPSMTYVLNPKGNWELSGKFPILNRGKNEKRMKPFNVEKITIHDGQLIYEDRNISHPATITKIDSIEAHVTKLQLPTEDEVLPTHFEATFHIENQGEFHAEGQGDFLSPQMNFEADVEVKDILISQFAPYYQNDIPVTIDEGTLKLKSHAVCTQDFLKAPAHIEIQGLKVTPKQSRLFGFASDTVVESLKNKNGNLELDTMISGPITNPQFHLSTNLSQAFVKGLSATLTQGLAGAIGDVGSGLSEGIHSGIESLKGLFR